MRSSVRKAEYWSGEENGRIRCSLCPHGCLIPQDGYGICGIRGNHDGILIAEGYGIYPAIHMDPIEKKPLNHFLPGSSILSVGSVGCNLSCLHCQNWSLARARPDTDRMEVTDVDRISELADSRGSIGVAFTYNEPTINYEFIMDASEPLKRNGSRIVLVTNGYLSNEPWNDLMDVADAANIDIKGFKDEFYREVAGGSLEPVLRNTREAFRKGVHIEIAYLVIPGKNDDNGQIDGFLDWMDSELSMDVPVHFNRFHPDHRMMDTPPTPPETLIEIRKKAQMRGLSHVFIGNMGGKGFNDTVCPDCGKLLIRRDGFLSPGSRISNGSCPRCGRSVYGAWDN